MLSNKSTRSQSLNLPRNSLTNLLHPLTLLLFVNSPCDRPEKWGYFFHGKFKEYIPVLLRDAARLSEGLVVKVISHTFVTFVYFVTSYVLLIVRQILYILEAQYFTECKILTELIKDSQESEIVASL